MFENTGQHKGLLFFTEYWKIPLIQEMSKKEQVHCCLFILLSVYMTTIVIDVLSNVSMGMFFLATSLLKAIGYTIGMVAAEILITYFSKRDTPYSGLSVGKTWIISFAGFVIGFLLLEPYRIYFGHLGHHGSETSAQLFIRITPVWIFITFLFVQFHLNRSLQSELRQLQKINADLEKSQTQPTPELAGCETADFVIPGTLALDAGKISFVNVIEHYSYVHFWQEGVLKKREIKMPLKDMLALLPDSLFMQIHRSYIINISHITKLEKSGRSYDLFLKGIDDPIAISRYRISEVLPRLGPFLGKANQPSGNSV